MAIVLVAPGVTKNPTVPIAVSPAGLACSYELWLQPYGLSGKSATTGVRPFTSTGTTQGLTAPIDMPTGDGEFQVNIDVLIQGQAFGNYMDPKHVIVPRVDIGDVTW